MTGAGMSSVSWSGGFLDLEFHSRIQQLPTSKCRIGNVLLITENERKWMSRSVRYQILKEKIQDIFSEKQENDTKYSILEFTWKSVKDNKDK